MKIARPFLTTSKIKIDLLGKGRVTTPKNRREGRVLGLRDPSIYMMSYPLIALVQGNPYLNNLSWVIYADQEEYPAVNASVARAVLPPCLKVSSNRFGGWHVVILPPVRRLPCAWSPTSKPAQSRPQPLLEALQLAHHSNSRCTLQHTGSPGMLPDV
jgi:hypothetical protein